jgi:hypothetical protein
MKTNERQNIFSIPLVIGRNAQTHPCQCSMPKFDALAALNTALRSL